MKKYVYNPYATPSISYIYIFINFQATYIEWGPGIIFGTCCVIATLLQLLLSETSGKELPQSVQQIKEWDKDQDQENDSKTRHNV